MKIEIIETRDRFLPLYEQDDGALTNDQIRAIRDASSAMNTLSESNGAKSYELGNPEELLYNSQLADKPKEKK